MSNVADSFDSSSSRQGRSKNYPPHGRTVMEVLGSKQDVTFTGNMTYFLTDMKLLAPVDGPEAFARTPGERCSYYQDLKYPDNMGLFKGFLEQCYAALNGGERTVVKKKEFTEAIGAKQAIVGAVIVCEAFPSKKKDGTNGITQYQWSQPTAADLEMVGIVNQKMAERRQALIDSLGAPAATKAATSEDDVDLDDVFGEDAA